MAESTLSLSAEQIGKSRSLLREGWELDLGAADSLCDQAIEALTLHATLAAEIERRELAERALADAQECVEQKDASLLRGADAMTKDAEFIRSLKAELAKLRAPVEDVEEEVFSAVRVGADDSVSYEPCNVVPADIARQLAAQVRERDARIAVIFDTGYTPVFNAIAAACKIEAGHLSISVEKFRNALTGGIDGALIHPTGLEKQS